MSGDSLPDGISIENASNKQLLDYLEWLVTRGERLGIFLPCWQLDMARKEILYRMSYSRINVNKLKNNSGMENPFGYQAD